MTTNKSKSLIAWVAGLTADPKRMTTTDGLSPPSIAPTAGFSALRLSFQYSALAQRLF
jgi:hypothetical protein